jgi:CheY-like chemotaxis protein
MEFDMGIFDDSVENISSFAGQKVLIVDDEDSIVLLFRSILEFAFNDIEVDIARNGMQAVESFRSKQHGLLLMDLHMPIMDGFSAYDKINQLCASESWNMPSVIFCTGFAPSDKMRKVLDDNPCNGYLPKPISPDDLIGAIKSSMKSLD